MISDEYSALPTAPHYPKTILLEKNLEQILIRSLEAYRKSDISISMGVTATAIDRSNKQLILYDGATLDYDKLVLTTGARVRKIDIPSIDLKGDILFTQS